MRLREVPLDACSYSSLPGFLACNWSALRLNQWVFNGNQLTFHPENGYDIQKFVQGWEKLDTSDIGLTACPKCLRWPNRLPGSDARSEERMCLLHLYTFAFGKLDRASVAMAMPRPRRVTEFRSTMKYADTIKNVGALFSNKYVYFA